MCNAASDLKHTTPIIITKVFIAQLIGKSYGIMEDGGILNLCLNTDYRAWYTNMTYRGRKVEPDSLERVDDKLCEYIIDPGFQVVPIPEKNVEVLMLKSLESF